MQSRRTLVVAALLASLAGVSAVSADPAADKAQYDKQRAECVSGKSNQDQATCLKEAGAAFAEAKRGNLNDTGADYRRDQMERCKALTGSEQKDCLSRMKGSGTVSGSVAGGGVLREKRTTEVVSPARVIMVPPAASAPN